MKRDKPVPDLVRKKPAAPSAGCLNDPTRASIVDLPVTSCETLLSTDVSLLLLAHEGKPALVIIGPGLEILQNLRVRQN